MREEIITSGRMNPHIDPYLEIWHWHIPLYLFLGGLAAGILFFAGLYVILGKEDKYIGAVRRAPIIVPFLLVIGLLALFLDLKHKLYFWQLYTTIRLQSPMSWGAWTLMGITPLSIIWAALHIREWFPNWDWKFSLLKDIEKLLVKYKVYLAWLVVYCSVILGIYTGILFSAFNARPLWNTSILYSIPDLRIVCRCCSYYTFFQIEKRTEVVLKNRPDVNWYRIVSDCAHVYGI